MSCHYSLPDTRLPELDIKWYHGASPSPFMVFLPHHPRPRPGLQDRDPVLHELPPPVQAEQRDPR